MKVLNLAYDDYANFSHDNANALRSVGIECVDLKTLPHPFKYPNSSRLSSWVDIKREINKADVIQIMHSGEVFLDHAITAKKRIIVYHTGTKYRMDPSKYNTIFNPYVERSIIALGEFAGKGSKNETYIVGSVDTNKLKPSFYNGGVAKISHLPSNPSVKGTDKINKIVSDINDKSLFQYLVDIKRKQYLEQLKMISSCDIYLELFAPTQNGRPYGSWGITALEATALGKIVFTNHTSRSVYLNSYGELPALEAWEDETVFKNRLETILKNPSTIRKLQEDARNWVVRNHSYQATGNRLKKLLYGN